VVVLSQLSRDLEKRTDHRPQLSDLRDSGSLEQDADVVLFVHRPAVYGETDDNRNLAEVHVGKQRNGPTGVVRLEWLNHLTRFENPTSTYPQAVPRPEHRR
jgi:replicative DNA helicase